MTAVIGILNKNGMTMAADSAVTVTGGNSKKIYNTANKIFTLSKYHPIGIMIYSSSTFMSIPWEIIIKLYRKELKDTYFDRVEDYKNDFIEFLKRNNYFTTEEAQITNLKQFAFWNLNRLKDDTIKSLSEGLTEEELVIEFQININSSLTTNIRTFDGATNILLDFVDYSLEDFTLYAETSIFEVIDIVFEGIELTDEIRKSILELYWNFFRTSNFIGFETGLIFGGFGEKEIYPSITSIKVSEVIDNKLRFADDRSDKISDANNGSILPFAQTDVIDMFIKGIDPEIDSTYLSVLEKFLSKYNQTISDLLEPENPDLAEQIKQIDINSLVTEFKDELNQIKIQKQIIPTVDTVAILSKEDLAEMAESLIYLTYLKRRISSNEESVGGPIDVAIISKGDGFIWKKRKHYFNEELNKHFMANYFNK